MTDQLRPLLKEKNEKKKLKDIKLPVKKFEWGEKHSLIFEKIKTAVANIAQINYYDPQKETRVKCDASHSGLGATLEQSTKGEDWIPIAFASRYLNVQEKKYSINELELLATIWAVDRFKHYLLGKEFILATDRKALTSALGEQKSNKTYQSRLTRWVDRLLPYQFKVIHIPGKDMGIVDYLSREPNGEPWPESELDEKFAVASINQFHASLDCLNSRLLETNSFIGKENFLECSERTNTLDEWSNTSSPGCYSNRSAQNQTKFDRNENVQNSRFCNNAQNSLNKTSHCVQLINSEEIKQKIETEKVGNRRKKKTEKRVKKTITTFQRTRTLQRGTSRGHESDGSNWERPPIEWKKVIPQRRNDNYQISVKKEEPQKLWSFWDLVGSERTDISRPENSLQLEASTHWGSNQDSSPNLNSTNIVEVDLTIDSTSESTDVNLVSNEKEKHNKGECRQAEDKEDNDLTNLSKLFDKNLLAELTIEDTWMDRLRRVIERKD